MNLYDSNYIQSVCEDLKRQMEISKEEVLADAIINAGLMDADPSDFKIVLSPDPAIHHIYYTPLNLRIITFVTRPIFSLENNGKDFIGKNNFTINYELHYY